MIKNRFSLSMSEAQEYVNKKKDSEVDVKAFMKKFTKLKPEEAKKLREELEGLNILKINSNHISKMIDILPRDKEELNKIASDASLDENEIEQILNTIKPHL